MALPHFSWLRHSYTCAYATGSGVGAGSGLRGRAGFAPAESSSGSSSYINHLPDYSLTIPAVTAGDPWAGQGIGIALLQTSTTADEGGYWDIDNVRLTTPISAAWTARAAT